MRLGLDDIILVLQQSRLRWYGHMLRKEDNDCVKKCMEYEVEVSGQEVDQRKLGERLSTYSNFMALNSLLCADVALRNCSLTHSLGRDVVTTVH